MNNSYFKAFLIGSSWISFVIFFRAFYRYNKHAMIQPTNCIQRLLNNMDPYYFYTLTAPLYLGTMSMLAIILTQLFNIKSYYSFFIIGIISATIISTSITVCDLYKFSKSRLREQYMWLYLYHSLVFGVLISGIYHYPIF